MVRIIKTIAACCLLMVVTSSLSEAQNIGNESGQKDINNESLKIQAGIKGNIGLTSLMGSYAIGGYGSYNITDFLSLGGELAYIRDWYFLSKVKHSSSNSDTVAVDIGYIPISFIAKIFPPKYPNFRFLGGIRLGRIVHYRITTLSIRNFSLDKISKAMDAKSKGKERNCQNDKGLTKWTCDLVVGYEYEQDFGLFGGIEFNKGLITIMEAEDSHCHCTVRCTIGYNFAKFFE